MYFRYVLLTTLAGGLAETFSFDLFLRLPLLDFV